MAVVQNPGALRPPIAPAGGELVNYPFDHWWVAGLSSELVAGRPLARRFLGKPVVLFRTTDGTATALEDRCPHRAAPLSLGDVTGDTIACRYHGMRFGADGKCSHVPTQDKIPPSLAVRAYPVIEKAPLIWIWMGDPAHANTSAPTDLPWLADPTWALIGGAMQLKANYMSLKENVLDLTHFGFVHANSFAIADWTRPPDVSIDAEGAIRFELKFPRKPVPKLYADLTGLGETRAIERMDWGRSISPAIHEAGMEIVVPDPAPGERTTYSSCFTHITTPETSRSTHYWWFRGCDYGQNDAAALDAVRQTVVKAFNEDKDLLEAIQAAADADPDYANGPEISVAADKAGIQARRHLDRLLRQENQPS